MRDDDDGCTTYFLIRRNDDAMRYPSLPWLGVTVQYLPCLILFAFTKKTFRLLLIDGHLYNSRSDIKIKERAFQCWSSKEFEGSIAKWKKVEEALVEYLNVDGWMDETNGTERNQILRVFRVA
jgi:hypothetical protein